VIFNAEDVIHAYALAMMRKGVREVLDGTASEFESRLVSPHDVASFLAKSGARARSDIKQGWSWSCIAVNGVAYELHNDAFYGPTRFFRMEPQPPLDEAET